MACTNPNIVVTTLASLTVTAGNSVTLQATATGGTGPYSYHWTGPNGFSSNQQNPVLSNCFSAMDGTYYVTVMDTGISPPCSSTGTFSTKVTVVVQPIYILRDCARIQPDFATSTDMSSYLGKTIKTCINTVPRNKTPLINILTLFDCCGQGITVTVPYTSETPISIVGNHGGAVIIFPSYPGICFGAGDTGTGIPDLQIDWTTAIPGIDYQLYSDCVPCMTNWINNGYPPCPAANPNNWCLLTNCCDPADTLKILISDGTLGSIGVAVNPPNTATINIINSPYSKKCWTVSKPDLISVLARPIDYTTSINNISITTCPPDPESVCNCNEWPDGCYCVEVYLCSDLYPAPALNCNTSSPWSGIIISEFDNCPACNCKHYILTDCEDPDHIITVTNDLLLALGKVIKIEGCDTCWEVSGPFDCDGNETCINLTSSIYDTCELCLPPVIPVPAESLRPRAVKPGYNTPGCSPEYTEKIYCRFAEAVYSKMIAVRYGLTMCCQEDFDKFFIRKQELDLRAIYDPLACIPPPVSPCCEPCEVTVVINDINPTTCPDPQRVSAAINVKCIEYTVTTEFKSWVYYKDCCGDNQAIFTASTTICAQGVPTSVLASIAPVIPTVECSVPQCFTWVLSAIGSARFEYRDCNGQYHIVALDNVEITVCGISARLRNGEGTVTKYCKECETCKCYDVQVLSETTCGFSIINCATGNEIKVNAYYGHNYFCSSVEPFGSDCVKGIDYNVFPVMNCGEPDSPCVN